jgi:hypothetical protein
MHHLYSTARQAKCHWPQGTLPCPVDQIIQLGHHKLSTAVQLPSFGGGGSRGLLAAVRDDVVSGGGEGGKLGACEQRQLA